MLLWLMNSPSPQEIHDRIMRGDSDFLQNLIEYLESLQVGGFSKPAEDLQKDIDSKIMIILILA